MFRLESDVIKNDERDTERIRILDMLGITTELRISLLGAKIRVGANKSQLPVYSHRIYWCSCHVHDNDMI